jgi:hypothetical protein
MKMDITTRSYLFYIAAGTQGITQRNKSLYENNFAGKPPTQN